MRRAGTLSLPVFAIACLAAVDPGRVGPTRPPDFVLDVLPLLQRQGCASAYCHGAATGQAGFKLSLFGSDPAADHAAITRALGGRRLDLAEPEQSLLLQKPLRRVAHGGGRRLRDGSPEHILLLAWIAGGAPYQLDAGERLTRLSAHRAESRLVVEARFSGAGRERVEDVTELSLFSSSDDRVASVGRDGTFEVVGPGEAFLFARYGGRSARLALVQRFAAPPPAPPAAAAAPLDAAFAARMRELGLEPAPPAPPLRLLRRLHLDLTGMPPSSQAQRRFLELPADTRVATTVTELLATKAFAEMLGRRLAEWLELPAFGDETPAGRRARDLLARVRAFASTDDPWPELTATLLGERSAFLQQRDDPRDRAELVARTLLGVRVGCARCHDHPHDRWRRTDHLAFAACFADPRPAPRDTMAAVAAGGGVLFDSETGLPVTPRLLPMVADALADDHRPQSVHAFVHEQTHDQAARSLCNRVFAWLLGRGLVEPLDDHRDTNPATHESWLAVLQATFHAGGDRLRPLVAAIATSRVYGLDTPGDEADADARTRWFAWRHSKALDRDTLRRAITGVLGVEEAALPVLPPSPLRRRLELLNGDAMVRALHAPGNVVEALAALGGEPREQLEALFEVCLTRLPTAAERAALLPSFDAEACAFALVMSREFEFLR